MNISNILMVAGIAVIVLFLWGMVFSLLFSKRQIRKQGYKSIPILTQNEINFLQKMKIALPEYKDYIYPQVAFSAFIKPAMSSKEKGYLTQFRRISQKRADFVITDQQFNVIVIVECDDRTHNKVNDIFRDNFTESAKINTVRIHNSKQLEPNEVRIRVLAALPQNNK